ncbi:MAG: hypothetical protein AAFZ07_19315 [Actinomycetota bacterium]
MAKSRWWNRQTEEASPATQYQAEFREEQREEQIDRTGTVPGERYDAAEELRADQVEAEALVDGEAIGIGVQDPGALDTGDLGAGLEAQEVAGGLEHSAELGAGTPSGQNDLDTDPASMVSDGGRTPLDDVYDQIEAEDAAADGTPDAGPAGGAGPAADPGGESVHGPGHTAGDATFSDTDGLQQGPWYVPSKDGIFASIFGEDAAENVANYFTYGPPDSTRATALNDALDQIDATGQGTDPPTPAPADDAGKEEEDGSTQPESSGQNDDGEQDDGSGSDDGSGGDEEGTDDGSATGDEGHDDGADDGADDASADDGTDAADDPPPADEIPADPESHAPPPTQEQIDAAESEMIAEQSWDVDPGWDDPGGDGPGGETINLDTRPAVDPYETVDGHPPDFDDVPEGGEDRLAAELGELVQPGDDDPDGVWGGDDPEGEPHDPFGGSDPAAAVDAAPAAAEAPLAEWAAADLGWNEAAQAVTGGAPGRMPAEAASELAVGAELAPAMGEQAGGAPDAAAAAPAIEVVEAVPADADAKERDSAPAEEAAAPPADSAPPEAAAAMGEAASMTDAAAPVVGEAVGMEGMTMAEPANGPADVEAIAMSQSEPIVAAEPIEMVMLELDVAGPEPAGEEGLES